jgi:hypothetical protein
MECGSATLRVCVHSLLLTFSPLPPRPSFHPPSSLLVYNGGAISWKASLVYSAICDDGCDSRTY